MAYKLPSGKWACSYCGKEFNDPVAGDSCRDSHELYYVPLSKTDLNRLIQFIYTKDESLLTKTLVKTITSYLRGN